MNTRKQYKVTNAHKVFDLWLDWSEVYRLTGTGKDEVLSCAYMLGLLKKGNKNEQTSREY